MDQDSPEPSPAVVAGRYRLEGLLGAGGMADVWEATDERLHRTVAVKILRPDPAAAEAESEQARRRFTAEGRLAARHSHPNIVSVFDAGEDDDRAYLVMERIDGPTLGTRLAEGPMSDHEVQRVMADTLAALDAAHAAGVVHRDIKPTNILLDPSGTWKVADFGIAQLHGATDDTSGMTQTGLLVGTPRYTAPERFAGQPATPASDIYSAGVVMGDAIGGRTDAHPDLLAIAAGATSFDPADRFPSAQAMAAALAAVTLAPIAEAPPAAAPDGGAIFGSTGAVLGSAAADRPTTAMPATGTGADDRRAPGAVTPAQDLPTIAFDATGTQVLAADPTPVPRRRRALAAAALVALLVVGAIAIAAASQDDTPEPPSTTPTTSTLPLTTTAPPTTAPPTTARPTTVPPTTVAKTPEPKPDPKDAEPKGKGKAGKN